MIDEATHREIKKALVKEFGVGFDFAQNDFWDGVDETVDGYNLEILQLGRLEQVIYEVICPNHKCTPHGAPEEATAYAIAKTWEHRTLTDTEY